MNPRIGHERPDVLLEAAGRWCAVVVVSAHLVFQVPSWFGGRAVIEVAAGLAQVAACLVLLWSLRAGLLLSLIPMGMTLAFGSLDADDLLLFYLPAVVVARGRPRQIALVLVAEACYGVIRGLRVGNVAESVVIIPVIVFAVSVTGLLLRLPVVRLRRGAARLELLADDVAEIRSGERLRLASELRTLVSARLEQAQLARGNVQLSSVRSMRDAMEAVRVVCLDAVSRVRGLVGMLREEPLAEGSDESLAPPSAAEELSLAVERLRAQGIAVELTMSPLVNERNLVTQLTISRLLQLVQQAAETERPEAIDLVVACPADATVVEVRMLGCAFSRQLWSSEFDRLRERVRTLGGTLKLTTGGEGQHVTMILSETLRTAQHGEEGKSRDRGSWQWRLGTPLMLIAVIDLALWLVLQQTPVWPLLWATLGCLAIVLLRFWPRLGAVPAILAFVGMMTTPGTPPVAWSALTLMGTWRVAKLRNVRFTAIFVAVALFGLIGLSLVGRLVGQWVGFARDMELNLALVFVMLVLGLGGFTLTNEYREEKTRQAEQSSVLLAAVERAQLEERNLLARELHDVVAHHLSVILLQCMAYGDSEDPGELRKALGRIENALTAAEGELRLLTSVMADTEDAAAAALVRPTTVGEHLLESLTSERFKAEFRIDPRVDDLAPITQRTLTRVMQEGVTNILRYARRGSRCLVELRLDDDSVRLTVRSQMPERRRKSQLSLGYGLTGIRERVDLSGGKFRAGPEEGEWVVHVELPLVEYEAETLGGPSAYMR